jgi:UDP-N-acetylmuramoyl-L-alanyl-D-glutamate--2,6-diaminopimelate ligase
MLFSELLQQAGVEVLLRRGEAEISSVVSDSRRCGAGCCFVAVRGPAADGHAYIASAVASGGSALVCEDPTGVAERVPIAIVRDSRVAAGRLAHALRGWPARKLTAIGVTGTKGKSTVTYLIRSVLGQAGFRPALLGTIAYQTGKRSIEAGNTTPGAVELAEMAEEMVSAGSTHLVMEVSSHALHQARTAGVDFRVGVFTNLSGEHMDYHRTMEEYLRAKRLLFDGLAPGASAVINAEDPAGARMAELTRASVLWYGLDGPCGVSAQIEHSDVHGTRLVLKVAGRQVPMLTPLIGRHNVMNCLAAAGVGAALGIDADIIAAGLSAVGNVPGRLQRVDVAAPFQVFVDYAHTDDALEKALTAVRPLTKGRLIVVFGCGGDRDRTKRPRMGAVAERLADMVVVTSDNPRTEQPAAIIDEILAGLSPQGRGRALVESDRRKAIEQAIASATGGDVVVLAGKGHENYQIIGTRKIHFDDAEVAAEAMRRAGK